MLVRRAGSSEQQNSFNKQRSFILSTLRRKYAGAVLLFMTFLSFASQKAVFVLADVTTSTWSTSMTQYHSAGTYYISTTNSGSSSAEMQFTSIGTKAVSNAVYMSESPQSTTGGGFTLSYEMKIDSSSLADEMFTFIGLSSVPSSSGITTSGNGVTVSFNVYSNSGNGAYPGIYLYKVSSSAVTTLASYTTGVSASGSWESFTIQYTPSSTNTWKVSRSVQTFLVFTEKIVCHFPVLFDMAPFLHVRPHPRQHPAPPPFSPFFPDLFACLLLTYRRDYMHLLHLLVRRSFVAN
jgi:hypothetical protein